MKRNKYAAAMGTRAAPARRENTRETALRKQIINATPASIVLARDDVLKVEKRNLTVAFYGKMLAPARSV
jgi:hypothetical protein